MRSTIAIILTMWVFKEIGKIKCLGITMRSVVPAINSWEMSMLFKGMLIKPWEIRILSMGNRILFRAVKMLSLEAKMLLKEWLKNNLIKCIRCMELHLLFKMLGRVSIKLKQLFQILIWLTLQQIKVPMKKIILFNNKKLKIRSKMHNMKSHTIQTKKPNNLEFNL